jgi:phosphatidylglycerophosphatase C
MTAAPPVVAAFDVDGTLTMRDCVRPFLQRVGGRRRIAWSIVRRPFASVVAAARRDRDAVKEIVVGGVYRTRRVDEIDALGRAFAAEVAAFGLRSDVLERLRWHQREGHHTVLVSASLRSYLAPLGERLGVDAVLCTDVASVAGRYGDRLHGPNCRAEEKWIRLSGWMWQAGLGRSTLWAYGDSRGDREMLAEAHHPVWVQGTTVQPVPEVIAS